VVDELLLYCYHYDPSQGRYGVMVMNLVRAGGILTILAIGGLIFMLRREEKLHPREGHA
jgi:protein SCO1/2